MKTSSRLIRKVFSALPFEAKLKIIDILGFKVLNQEFMNALTYCEGGLVTDHKCDFLNDPSFLKAYNASLETGSWPGEQYRWKIFVCCWAAERASSLEGDFVECGVNTGGLSRAVVDFVDFQDLSSKTFYLMDTYEGLVGELITDEERAKGRKSGGYLPCYEQVVETFKEFGNVKIVRGAIPGTLSQVVPPKVSYLSIDMNCVLPEIAAIEHFWGRLVPGAFVILDDYGWKGFEAQKDAFDDFAASRGTRVLPLPTGQGLMVKE